MKNLSGSRWGDFPCHWVRKRIQKLAEEYQRMCSHFGFGTSKVLTSYGSGRRYLEMQAWKDVAEQG